MSKIIEASDVSETEIHKFATFASDIGLSPGEWPEQLLTTLGNKQPLFRSSKRVVDGDLQWVLYTQFLGCIDLKVFND